MCRTRYNLGGIQHREPDARHYAAPHNFFDGRVRFAVNLIFAAPHKQRITPGDPVRRFRNQLAAFVGAKT